MIQMTQKNGKSTNLSFVSKFLLVSIKLVGKQKPISICIAFKTKIQFLGEVCNNYDAQYTIYDKFA